MQMAYHNMNNEQVVEYFANRASARMFKNSLDARGYLVKIELVVVDAKEIRNSAWVWTA